MDGLSKSEIPGRKKLVHKVHTLRSSKLCDAIGWDDELEFNTQNSSQWDSLVHWHHQPTGLAYNGFNPTQEDMSAKSTAENKMPTIDHWHTRGGVVGRGVLIDYVSYAEEKGVPYHPFGGNRITVQDIEAVAAHYGVEFKHGDIFLIRLGSTEFIDSIKPEDMGGASKIAAMSGVHGCEETARWFWNKHFSAAVADSNSFEAFPPVHPDGSVAGISGLGKFRFFVVFERELLIRLTSFALLLPELLRYAYRRIVGSEPSCGALQEDWTVLLHAHIRTAKRSMLSWLSAECHRHFLRSLGFQQLFKYYCMHITEYRKSFLPYITSFSVSSHVYAQK